MKIEKKQKETQSKFNLEKMRVAKLDNRHLISGGFATNDDIRTTTGSVLKTLVTD